MNFFKSIIGIILFTFTILIVQEPVANDITWNQYLLLVLSGMIGIGISETFLFGSINRLGASLSAIVNCSYSPFVIFLSLLFLGETLSIFQFLGVCLIISAVIVVSQKKPDSQISRKELLIGVLFGIASTFSMAIGIILMKPVLDQTPLLLSTLVRFVGGIIPPGIIILFHPKRSSIWEATFSIQNWRPMIPAAVLGGYVAVITWMGGMKYTQASIASALNQMNTIFVFILGLFILKEKSSPMKFLALLLAVSGVYLVTFL